jgi:hypothetical protein
LNYPAIDDEGMNIFDIPNRTGTPERRLLLAILERALLDYVGNDEREYNEACEWIFEDVASETAGEFSFSWICSQLDLDISDIKAKIKLMPRRGESRVAPWYMTKGYLTKGYTKNDKIEVITNKQQNKELQIKQLQIKPGKVINFLNNRQKKTSIQ